MAGDTAPTGARKARAAKKTTTTPRRPGAPSKDDKLKEALTQTYIGIGIGGTAVMGMLGYTEDQCNAAAAVVSMQATSCAESWVQLAQTNPDVRAALEKMTSAGGWGSVIFAHIGLGMGVVAAVKATAPEPVAISADDEAAPAAVRVAPEDVESL